MINKILVEATIKAFKYVFERDGIPYVIRKDEESKYFKDYWDEAEETEERALAYRQALPAVERIISLEPYINETNGEPLCMRLNYLERELERDSFGEIMLERADLNWRFTISVKNDAKIITTLPVADREIDLRNDEVRSAFNAIDDFGERIFGVPCSNEYFKDMNEILLNIAPRDKDNWSDLIKEDSFVYGTLITPMLGAIGREMPRIFEFHPEAGQKLIEYFYGKIDYYFIFPVQEAKVTRIGAVNAHGGLGRMPGNPNLTIPRVALPSKLLDVRKGRGLHGEIAKDTIQLSFDGGWSMCIMINPVYDTFGELEFDLKVYLPSTPFGSYRDQVEWAEA